MPCTSPLLPPPSPLPPPSISTQRHHIWKEGKGSLFIKVTLGEGAGAFPQRSAGQARPSSLPQLPLLMPLSLQVHRWSEGIVRGPRSSEAQPRGLRGAKTGPGSQNQRDLGQGAPGQPHLACHCLLPPPFRGLPGFLSENFLELNLPSLGPGGCLSLC